MTTKDIDALSPLLTDERSLKREAVKRRKQNEEMSVYPELLARYESEGWKKTETLKKTVRIIKERSFDERLENRFWMVLFRLGYPQLNKGRNFTVSIERRGAEPLRKQVDVFAKDDETVIVAECKASDRVRSRSLQKDLEEFGSLKGPIADAVKRHYGSAKKLKIIWLFVTENIVWQKPDKERAVGLNIRIVTEKELRYFSQIADHIGRSARYQFLAEFLKDQEIPGLTNTKVPAIKGKLGGRAFYCFTSTPRHLLKIAFVNHRSLNDPEGAPAYQRLISRGRLKDVANFITNGGFFPNNLLINFVRPLKFEKMANSESSDVSFGSLILPSRYRSAWIIDGQHRLYGFSPVPDKFLDQILIVVAFESLPKAEEANLFVTINHEQKTVPKHLLDDLEGALKWESTVPSERIGAIASRVINFLNTDIDEPFYNRVTQQGIKGTVKTCLTIPGIKETIIDTGLVGKATFKNTKYEPGPLTGHSDSETLDRARTTLNQFFKIISGANPALWEKGREGYLSDNVGVQAYIRLLAALIKFWESSTALDAKQSDPSEMMAEIEEYLDPIVVFLKNATDETMKERFTVVLGSSGPKVYFYRLSQIIKQKRAQFEPDGLTVWEAEQSDERNQAATDKLRKIETEINRFIFEVLKKRYGVEKNNYWETGVPDDNTKVEAYKRSLADSPAERGPLESYLNCIDYKKIVENKQNWVAFKEVFNIPERGEKGHAKNLKWMDTINELRRIPGHPSPDRRFKMEDYEYIDWVYAEFNQRLADCRTKGIDRHIAEVEALIASQGAGA